MALEMIDQPVDLLFLPVAAPGFPGRSKERIGLYLAEQGIDFAPRPFSIHFFIHSA